MADSGAITPHREVRCARPHPRYGRVFGPRVGARGVGDSIRDIQDGNAQHRLACFEEGVGQGADASLRKFARARKHVLSFGEIRH